MKSKLTISKLLKSAKSFCESESSYQNKDLFGITDGKAVGTYIEHKFLDYLRDNFIIDKGSSSRGIDLPQKNILTDIKVTSIKQPQSSCPFRDAKQKIFGLGYNILLFVYEKKDDQVNQKALLDFVNCSFIKKENTADYTTTFRLLQLLKDGANKEEIIAYLYDRNIPADDITINQIADKIINEKLYQGYLTISNALQWRLQYSRVVHGEQTEGISKLIDKLKW